MAKRRTGGPELILEGMPRDVRRRARPRRTLFLPSLVAEVTDTAELNAAEQRRHAAVLKWERLEREGNLKTFTETSADGTFLTDIFGVALEYPLKTDSPDSYNLSIKWSFGANGTADGALGHFPRESAPLALIELKDSTCDLDRDKSNGRTAVQQCWDYLAQSPQTPWGIVSNFSEIRLYHRDRTPQAYEQFTLADLADWREFRRFEALLHRTRLVGRPGIEPPLQALLKRTGERDKKVGDDLYDRYRAQRNALIAHLHREKGKPLDVAIRVSQKILDRVIFIAFCEDRGLLPSETLKKAWTKVPEFSRATNPRWQNFLALFHMVDKGGAAVDLENGYNGGLFREDPDVDSADLADIPYVNALQGFGEFDFRDEVNVDVLGHLFERSITELEKLRVGGLFALTQGEKAEGGKAAEPPPADGKRKQGRAAADSAAVERKRFGVYYTPPAFTGLIVERTVDVFARERFAAAAKTNGCDPDNGRDAKGKPVPAFWRQCLDELRSIKIVDPACGSGAFLIRAYDAMEAHYRWATDGLALAERMLSGPREDLEAQVPDWVLHDNLHGMDLSQEAVEITQLALWIRSARKGRTLLDLSANVVCGNSLVDDPAVHPKARKWAETFPEVFAREGDRKGFDCVVGNPPWERVKVQEREFFAITDPATAQSVSAADRRKRIEALPKANPELFAAYEAAKSAADRMFTHVRKSGQYPLTGKGDVNLYMLFAELARGLVSPRGFVGVLVPSGIATDDSTKEFFATLMDSGSLMSLYDFENKEGIFEDVHRSFKFSAVVFGGADRRTPQADFVFFAHAAEEVDPVNKKRHIPLTAADMKLFNPNTRTCPIFRTRRDAELTRAIYRRVPILIDENRKQGGNPWGVRFFTMFHQTNDAEHFKPREFWEGQKYRLSGNVFVKGKSRALPLYEGKMIEQYDHRFGSMFTKEENWYGQGQNLLTSPVDHANREFMVQPRFWVSAEEANHRLEATGWKEPWTIGFRDITNATNARTMLSLFLPRVAALNALPMMLPSVPARRAACLLGNFNALVFDCIVRQKAGGLHMNFFIVEQLPTLPPNAYADKCPWSRGGRETLEHWISERVLKLSCTAEDMRPLAEACGFKGSRGDGVHTWRESERARLRAELDAAYFHLYGISREDAEYMLTTFSNVGRREDERGGTLDGDTSPWLPGGTADLVLNAYDALGPLARVDR